MKVYKTQREVERDIKDGVLAINGDVKFECDIDINADDINAYNINANDINAYNITARNINANDINARNINADDITAYNINADDITAYNINANDISYWAFCSAYNNITCKSIKGRREPHQEPICLDGKLTIKKETKKKELLDKADELIEKAEELKEQAEEL
jgi:hypothetical protein